MKLQILGSGCARCRTLTAATEQAAQALGLRYELEKVTDLRQSEGKRSHLAGARGIAPESTAATAQSILDPERPIVLYCSAGHRAATLACRLQNACRRDVWNLEGGIFAWANAGLPIERAGQNTRRVHPYSRFFTRLLKPQKPAAPDASRIARSGESRRQARSRRKAT